MNDDRTQRTRKKIFSGSRVSPACSSRELKRINQNLRCQILKQAQKIRALSGSESQYRRMLDSLEGLIYICSADRKVEFANANFIKRCGTNPVGKPCYRMVHGRRSICPWCVIRKVLKGKRPRYEVQSPKDGRWYDVVNIPVRNATGAVSKMSVFTDITERKNAEDLVRQSSRDWQHTFDSVSDAVWLLDLDNRILRCNRATKKIFGKSPQKFLGRRCCEMIHGTRNPPKECPMLRMRRTRRRESSEFLFGKKWLSVTLDPIFDKSGALTGAIHIVSDITEHKKGEALRRQKEEQYRHLFESSKDAMMTLGPPCWKFSSANNSMVRMFRAKRASQLLSRSPWRLSPRKQPDGCISALKAKKMIGIAMRKGSHFFDWTHRRIDGTTFPAEVLLTRVSREGKSFLQATVRDIAERRKAEDELRGSEARFRSYFELPLAGIAITSPAKGWIRVNDRLCSMLGYSRKELLRKTWSEMTHPEDLAADLRQFKRLLAGKIERYSMEKRFIRKTGEIVWTSLSVGCVRKPDQSVDYVVALLEDITGRKQANEQLQANEIRFRTIYENAPVLINSFDPRGRCVLWNRECERVFGWTKKEVCSHKEPLALFYPDPAVRKRVMDTVMIRSPENIFREWHPRIKSGKEIVTMWANFRLDGGAVISIGYDITERKQAEEILNDNRRQLRDIIDAVPHMIFAKDRQGRFLMVNRALASALGKKVQEVVGKKQKDLQPVASEAVLFLKDDREVIDAGKGKVVSNAPFTDVAGDRHLLHTIKIPFKMAGVAEKAVLGVSVDVTEQRKVEEFRNDVIRTISHELRTPLSIEKGSVSLLLDGAGGGISPKQRELLEMVLSNIERLSRLIDDLLDISRVESGKLELHRKRCDLRDLVRDTVLEFRNKVPGKGLELRVSLPKEGSVVFVDRDKLIQVISNLIDNAIKFTKKGSIEVSVRNFFREVECSVRDTGLGIAPEHIGRIFEKFHQFARIAGAGEKGLGLGLPISKGILEAHQGKIWVKSGLGKGTRVTFALPRKSQESILSEKGS